MESVGRQHGEDTQAAKKDEVVLRYKRVLYPRALAMAALVAAVAALALWQRDFVISGVSANPYLNLTIFAGMAFGVALTFSHLFEMRDDFKALDGLYEALDDARGEEAADPVIREAALRRRDARLRQPAVLFRPPKLLGSGYLLLSQEIAGRGLLSVSNSTKKPLIDEIKERVDVRSNFTAYIGGMMVMLGLLGTFIGLMETVASVGTIISELDLSDSAGSDRSRTSSRTCVRRSTAWRRAFPRRSSVSSPRSPSASWGASWAACTTPCASISSTG